MDIVLAFERAQQGFSALVESMESGDWTKPTPNPGWDVRTLVNHLVNENLWTPPLFEGQTIGQVGSRFDGDVLGNEPLASWEGARSTALSAIKEPGAPERTIHVSWGDISGYEYISQLFADHLIHGWDLAKAIGADETLDPELADLCYEIFAPQEQMMRDSGAYGTKVEIPQDASPQTRLLALFGRKEKP